jgi:5-methylcytosine-specific restriction endonuclease McrA
MDLICSRSNDLVFKMAYSRKVSSNPKVKAYVKLKYNNMCNATRVYVSFNKYIFEKCRETDLEMDHIIERRYGGKDIIKNLQALCCKCHRRKSDLNNKNLQKQRKKVQRVFRQIPFGWTPEGVMPELVEPLYMYR